MARVEWPKHRWPPGSSRSRPIRSTSYSNAELSALAGAYKKLFRKDMPVKERT